MSILFPSPRRKSPFGRIGVTIRTIAYQREKKGLNLPIFPAPQVHPRLHTAPRTYDAPGETLHEAIQYRAITLLTIDVNYATM